MTIERELEDEFGDIIYFMKTPNLTVKKSLNQLFFNALTSFTSHSSFANIKFTARALFHHKLDDFEKQL